MLQFLPGGFDAFLFRVRFMRLHIDDVTEKLGHYTPDTGASARTRHHAAVAMVLFTDETDLLRTLLIKRAEHPQDPWSGQMALPGGRKDAADADLEATARRETEEELGLPLSESMLLGRLDDVETERLRDLDLSVACFVYHVPSLNTLSPNHEVAAVVRPGLLELLEAWRHAPYYFPHDPLHRRFPSVHYDSHIIWGLTYRVLDNLLRLAGNGLPTEDDVRKMHEVR